MFRWKTSDGRENCATSIYESARMCSVHTGSSLRPPFLTSGFSDLVFLQTWQCTAFRILRESAYFKNSSIFLLKLISLLRAMFTHDMVEAKQPDITMHSIDPSSMESLINFAYTGRVTISTSNVQNLMLGASFLQLTRVRDACADFLQTRLTPQNVLGIRTFAESLGSQSLVTSSNKFLQKHFKAVSESEEFCQLGLVEVGELVAREELHVASEEIVFLAVMRWIKQDVEDRSSHLPSLLVRVRLPLLTPQFLADKVAAEELIRSSHQCRDLLDEARDYHLMPERRPLLKSFKFKPRCCKDLVGVIYAVGGQTKSGNSLR